MNLMSSKVREISKETIETQKVPVCPLCGEQGKPAFTNLKDRLFDVAGEWALWRCAGQQCRSLWLNPRSTDRDVVKLYESYFTHKGPGVDGFKSLNALIECRVQKKRLGLGESSLPPVATVLGSIAAALPPLAEYFCGRVMWVQRSWRGRLLDVGCGAGDLLLRMKNYGWDVEGLEPDPIAAEKLRQRGIKVTGGVLPNHDLKEGSFDVITASHVIEHVGDPIAFLKACFKLLRPNGRIILATPNADSAGLKKFGKSWVHLDAPRHFVLFTPESLGAALRTASFDVDRITTSCRSAFFVTKTSRRLQQGAMRIGNGAHFSLGDKIAALLTFMQEGFSLDSASGQEIVAIGRKESPASSH
jgi:SAM-dependent methyltransferase